MTNRRYIPRFREFSGGLNLRDAQSELALDSLAAAYNITLDERGGANSRLGFTKYNGTPYNGGFVRSMFYWPAGKNLIVQVGDMSPATTSKLYKDTSTTAIASFNSKDRCAYADFLGKLYILHPLDGLFVYDGATVTSVSATVSGTTMAVWQNKLWVAGGNASGSHVQFCARGDAATWTPGTNGAGTVDLRDVDDSDITALGVEGGTDIVGRQGLLAFKLRSAYRINDSATGAYETLDTKIGAVSPHAIVSLRGLTYVLSERGIFATDGASPMRAVADQISPLFDPNQINYVNLNSVSALVCAGVRLNRLYFSLTRSGASDNDLMIELDPQNGWVTFNSNAASCYATYGKDTHLLLAGSPTVAGQVYQQFNGGTDDGAAINAYMQTSFIELHYGLRARLNEARVNARGTFTLSPLYDYDVTPTITRAISVPTGSATIHGGYQSVYNLGQTKTIAFRAEATTSTTATIPFQVPGSTTRTVGAWGLYGIDPYPVPAPLGRT